jgi:hypothetical protein
MKIFEAVPFAPMALPETHNICEDGSPDPSGRSVAYPDGFGQTVSKLGITAEIRIERPGEPSSQIHIHNSRSNIIALEGEKRTNNIICEPIFLGETCNLRPATCDPKLCGAFKTTP